MSKVVGVLRNAGKETWHCYWSPRGIFVLLALCFFTYDKVNPLVHYAGDFQTPFVPVVLPFIFYDANFCLMFGLITIFLFSEVPFVTRRTTYNVIRVGKRLWLIGKLARIFLTSVVYMLLETIISILMCGRNIIWENKWDIVWRSASVSTDYERIGLWVPRNVLIQFRPVEAMSRVFIVGCLVVTFIGFFMLLISLLVSTLVSILVTGMISVLPYVAINSAGYYAKIYYFTPMNWIGIIEYSKTYIYGGPDSMTILRILLAAVIFLIGLLLLFVQGFDLVEKGEEE